MYHNVPDCVLCRRHWCSLAFCLFFIQVKEANLTSDSLEVDDPKITIDPANDPDIAFTVAEKKWIPFYIKFPKDKLLKMEASILLPSEDNKAMFHATDLKFAPSPGQNVLCTTPDIDLQRAFVTTFEQTSNLSTFMQVSPSCLNA